MGATYVDVTIREVQLSPPADLPVDHHREPQLLRRPRRLMRVPGFRQDGVGSDSKRQCVGDPLGSDRPHRMGADAGGAIYFHLK